MVVLLWSDITHHIGVCDFVAVAGRNVSVHDRAEGVSAFNTLLFWHHRVLSNALAQEAQFVSIGCVPHVLGWWMASQLSVFQGLAGALVEDGRGNWRGRCGNEERCLGGIVIIVVTGEGGEGIPMKLHLCLVGNGCT